MYLGPMFQVTYLLDESLGPMLHLVPGLVSWVDFALRLQPCLHSCLLPCFLLLLIIWKDPGLGSFLAVLGLSVVPVTSPRLCLLCSDAAGLCSFSEDTARAGVTLGSGLLRISPAAAAPWWYTTVAWQTCFFIIFKIPQVWQFTASGLVWNFGNVCKIWKHLLH